ncbi:MAG: hypothetical protein N2712_02780 [Brevinematales bacterium]|nr:hypothetical protein [Brevinematales bacterium]
MILGVIQARVNSDRFPFKVLARFSDGTTVLERVIRQVKHSKLVDNIVVATNHLSFGIISSFVMSKFNDVNVVAGSDEDVLDRFVNCVSVFDDVDHVVRITADNPLTCPRYIDKVVEIHLKDKADLTHFLGIPLGTGVEVIKFEALVMSSKLAIDEYDREHVTPYIYKNRKIFKVLEPVYEYGNFQDIRVTLDTQDDYNFIDVLLHRMGYKIPVFVEDVIKFAPSLVTTDIRD